MLRLTHQERLLPALLVAPALVLLLGAFGSSCSQVGQSRQSSVGGDDSQTAVGAGTAGSGSATGNSTGSFLGGFTGSGTGGGSGTSGSGTGPSLGTASGSSQNTGSTLPNSESLEQCQAQNLAWVAVVNGGASPTVCSNQLVPWCCTTTEINARFPTMQSQLGAVFQNYISNQGEVLYACSVDAQNNYTFSMAKIVNGATTYNTATISGVFPVNTNDPTNNCPAVTTPELEKASLLLTEPGVYQGSY